jgi:iron complex outermembrane receptor protein
MGLDKGMAQLRGPQKSLLLAMLTMVIIAQTPIPGYTEESSTQSSQAVIPELELIKEEETVSIASRHQQPNSKAPSNVYVITDEDIRHSGAADIPTILRRVTGLDVMQTTGTAFNVSIRGKVKHKEHPLGDTIGSRMMGWLTVKY